jgi:hypothetical protein
MTSMTDHGDSRVSFSDESLRRDNSESKREGIGRDRDLVLGTGRENLLAKRVAKIYAP